MPHREIPLSITVPADVAEPYNFFFEDDPAERKALEDAHGVKLSQHGLEGGVEVYGPESRVMTFLNDYGIDISQCK